MQQYLVSYKPRNILPFATSLVRDKENMWKKVLMTNYTFLDQCAKLNV